MPLNLLCAANACATRFECKGGGGAANTERRDREREGVVADVSGCAVECEASCNRTRGRAATECIVVTIGARCSDDGEIALRECADLHRVSSRTQKNSVETSGGFSNLIGAGG